MAILKQAESGVPVSGLCRNHGTGSAAFYRWRAKFGGIDTSMIAEMKAMADKNRRLKRMYAKMAMQITYGRMEWQGPRSAASPSNISNPEIRSRTDILSNTTEQSGKNDWI